MVEHESNIWWTNIPVQYLERMDPSQVQAYYTHHHLTPHIRLAPRLRLQAVFLVPKWKCSLQKKRRKSVPPPLSPPGHHARLTLIWRSEDIVYINGIPQNLTTLIRCFVSPVDRHHIRRYRLYGELRHWLTTKVYNCLARTYLILGHNLIHKISEPY